jgi:hypothetical protein
MLLTVASATTLLSAPAVLADGGHGDEHRSDGNEHQVVVVNGTPTVVDGRDDNDNDEIQAVPAQPVQVVEVEPEANDVNADKN